MRNSQSTEQSDVLLVVNLHDSSPLKPSVPLQSGDAQAEAEQGTESVVYAGYNRNHLRRGM